MKSGYIETDAARNSAPLIPVARILADAASLAVCYQLSWIAFRTPYHTPPTPVLWLVHVVVLTLVSSKCPLSTGKNRKRRLPGTPAREVQRVIWTVAASSASVWLLSVLMPASGNRHPLELASICVLAFFAVPAARCGIANLLSRRNWWWKPCLLSGSADKVKAIVGALEAHPCFGFKPTVIFTENSARNCSLPGNTTVTTKDLDYAVSCAAEQGVDLALMPKAENRTDTEFEALKPLRETIKAEILEYPAATTGIVALWNALETVRKLPKNEQWKDHEAAEPSRTFKFLVNFLLVIALVPVLVPLLAVLAILVKLTSKGPIFYGQERVGRSGRKFTMWKFRTMVTDAEKILQDHLSRHPELREEWNEDRKLRNDPRITDFGRLLRLTSLDELPQLWNILKGEMTLVGPRAITESEIPNYSNSFEHYKRVLPGVTGLWQVSGRNNISYPERVCLDAYYVQNWSAWLEIYILARTPLVVFSCQGAY